MLKSWTSQEWLAILPSAREVWVSAQRKKLCKNDGLLNSTPDGRTGFEQPCYGTPGEAPFPSHFTGVEIAVNMISFDVH